ncbi:MAG: hypothetical protein GF316_07720 [Candidatus Lokiarchaeota archaeon]|nr:hypothetical protein [Candidatus Lokiarchaeota archaeon]
MYSLPPTLFCSIELSLIFRAKISAFLQKFPMAFLYSPFSTAKKAARLLPVVLRAVLKISILSLNKLF